MAHKFDDVETDQEARQKIEEKLSKLATKWTNALNELENLAEFKNRFDKEERHLIARNKCRLYADLQTEPVLHCNFFAAYERSLEMMTNIFLIPKDGTRSSRAIPIAIQLCPMKVLSNPTWGVANKEIYVDIDKKLTNRLCKIFAELSRVIVRRNKIESSKPNSAISRALGRDFQNVIFHYHQFLQIILSRKVESFRVIGSDEEDIVGFANTAENHPLFSPHQLEQWLNFKLAELEMLCSAELGWEPK